MPKGRVLSPSEREEIARMHAAGASAREIGKKLERSKTVVLNFLKAPAQYAQIKRSGRKRALSGDDERRLFAAITQRMAQPGVAGSPRQDAKRSAEQIRREFNVPLSTRRVQQLLSEWRREARRAHDQQQHEAVTAETEGADAAAEVAEKTLPPAPCGEQRASGGSTDTQASVPVVVGSEQPSSTSSDANKQLDTVIETQESSTVATETAASEPLASPSPEDAAIEV